MATQASKKAPPAKRDDRIHGAVLCKSDPRASAIIGQHSKGDIINLYNIDCEMLFRVDQAHMQFDMLQNYRPYILFAGYAEGVFLPKKMGLLFPNRCDQLDFRDDYKVPVQLTYALSDTEIAVMAGNGLFNRDWSCQGRILSSVLEIPCKIDYAAVARTPLTFVEIQDRLSMHTSTMQTGYKTLVSAFLPYQAQKHNLEERAAILDGPSVSRDDLEVRRRIQYEGAQVGFGAGDDIPSLAKGASFVDVAQARIRQRLKDQMEKGDVLGVKPDDGRSKNPEKTADDVAEAVRAIQQKTASERKRLMDEAAQRGIETHVSDIDAKLDDMAARMIYAGAEAIPLKTPGLRSEPLVKGPAPGLRPGAMDGPLSEKIPGEDSSPEDIEARDARVHQSAAAAAEAVTDIAGTIKGVKERKTRQQILAERRAARAAQADHSKVREAMEAEGTVDDSVKAVRHPSEAAPAKTPGKPRTASASAATGAVKDDILTTEIDIDEMMKGIGV